MYRFLKKIAAVFFAVLAGINFSAAADSSEIETSSGRVCDFSTENFWAKSLTKKNWEKVVGEFHEKIDKKFTAEISKMKSANEKICARKEVPIFDPENTANFSREILTELKNFECALLDLARKLAPEIQTGTTEEIHNSREFQRREIAKEIQAAGRAVSLALDNFRQMRMFFFMHAQILCAAQKVQSLAAQILRLQEVIKGDYPGNEGLILHPDYK